MCAAITLKVSVRHWVLVLPGMKVESTSGLLPAGMFREPMSPLIVLNWEMVTVEGPAMTNVEKSRRSWKRFDALT